MLRKRNFVSARVRKPSTQFFEPHTAHERAVCLGYVFASSGLFALHGRTTEPIVLAQNDWPASTRFTRDSRVLQSRPGFTYLCIGGYYSCRLRSGIFPFALAVPTNFNTQTSYLRSLQFRNWPCLLLKFLGNSVLRRAQHAPVWPTTNRKVQQGALQQSGGLFAISRSCDCSGS